MRAFGGPKTALVFAAHADDETLGAAGTIRRLVDEGTKVVVAVATDSTAAQYPGDPAAGRRRWHAFEEAMDLLGVGADERLGAPDMGLQSLPGVELAAWASRLVFSHESQLVLVTSPFDANADHRALAQAVGVACRPLPNSPVATLAWYEVASSTEWSLAQGLDGFRPNAAVDIETTLPTKLSALAMYTDEVRPFPHPRSIHAVESTARSRGVTSGLCAAEVFQVSQSIYR